MSIRVEFVNNNYYSLYNEAQPFYVKIFTFSAEVCLKSKLFSVVTLGPLHTFIHELGHAVAWRLVSGNGSLIEMSSNSLYGSILFDRFEYNVSSWKNSYVSLSGPLADVILSVALMFFSIAIKSFVPVSLIKPVQLWLVASSVFWICGELIYGAVSAIRQDNGDFGKIAKTGALHLVICGAILVTAVGFGVLGISQIYF